MAKKQAPKVHPGDAIEALRAFHESVAFALASMSSVASILESVAVTKEQAVTLAKTLRDAEARVTAHWEM